MQPTYIWNDFVVSCLTKKAKVLTAKSDFNLKTQVKVLDFIGCGGLERPRLLNVKPWENNPNPRMVL